MGFFSNHKEEKQAIEAAFMFHLLLEEGIEEQQAIREACYSSGLGDRATGQYNSSPLWKTLDSFKVSTRAIKIKLNNE